MHTLLAVAGVKTAALVVAIPGTVGTGTAQLALEDDTGIPVTETPLTVCALLGGHFTAHLDEQPIQVAMPPNVQLMGRLRLLLSINANLGLAQCGPVPQLLLNLAHLGQLILDLWVGLDGKIEGLDVQLSSAEMSGLLLTSGSRGGRFSCGGTLGG